MKFLFDGIESFDQIKWISYADEPYHLIQASNNFLKNAVYLERLGEGYLN